MTVTLIILLYYVEDYASRWPLCSKFNVHLSISSWVGYKAGTGRQWLSKRCVGDNTVKLRQSPH